MIIIRRESIRGKFFIVARDGKRVLAKKPWSKDFTVSKAKRIFRQNNTFTEGLTKRKLISRPSFEEVTDRRKKPSIPRKIPYRVVISGRLKDGTVIRASSMAKLWDNFNEAKEEADKSFLELLSAEISDMYDADEGLKHINEVVSLRSEIIFVR